MSTKDGARGVAPEEAIRFFSAKSDVVNTRARHELDAAIVPWRLRAICALNLRTACAADARRADFGHFKDEYIAAGDDEWRLDVYKVNGGKLPMRFPSCPRFMPEAEQIGASREITREELGEIETRFGDVAHR